MSRYHTAAMSTPGNTFFIVGTERSGTTLFRLMLDSHPELAVVSEFEYATDVMHDLARLPTSAEFVAAVEKDFVFRNHAFEIDRTLDLPALLQSFLDQAVARAGARHPGAIVHRHFDWLDKVWPNARYIHIVRDPRDVAPSVMKMGWAGNPWSAARDWVSAECAWDRLAPRLADDRKFELRMETLVSEPENTLQRVCAFLGIAYTDAMLSYPQRTTYAPPSASAAYRWKKTLKPGDVRQVEARVGALLTDRGYDATTDLKPLGILYRSWLKITDRYAHARWRMRHYGMKLYFSELISRRLGFKAWHASLDAERDRLREKILK